MERSEPSLVPEWLRSSGGGTGGGSSSHHFASSQADGPVSAVPRRSRSSKSISNNDSLHSPLLDRSSSSNSRRSSNSNGFSKHDKNLYGRSYSSFSRNQRDRDRERSTITDNWDSEYSDPLRGIITGAEDPLRRTQSMITRRQGEVPQRRIPADMRNGSHKNHDNGNGIHSVGSSVTGIQKVSFERDFPVLGSEERPKTPDLVRVSSPGLSRGIQSLSIGIPPLVGNEAWTSALAEVPTGAGSNSTVGSSPALPPASAASTSTSILGPVGGSSSSGLNMAEALVQAPAQSHNAPQPSVQSQRDEFALAQSKKLIPMTPLVPKTMVLSLSDKLKPKTVLRPSEAVVTPKNGVHHLSPLQVGSQPVRGAGVRVDGPKSPSSGRLLLLKPGRENGFSLGLKDLQSPTANNRVSNGPFSGSPSAASGPSKSLQNPKLLPDERKTSAFGLNPAPVVDKRTSRSNFFKLMREKSMNNNNTCVITEPEASGSSDVVSRSDQETKELARNQVTAETDTETTLDGETCTVADTFSHFYPNEKERAFLLSMGWEPLDDNAGGDNEGLTEEEIRAFKDMLMKLRPTTPRQNRVLQAEVFSHGGCSRASSKEPSTPASQTQA